MMSLLLLIIGAYLYLPVIGEFYLWYTDNKIPAGNVTLELFFHNLIYSSITYVIVLVYYSYTRKFYNKIGFSENIRDGVTLRKILILMTIFFSFVFYFAGYDYFFRGINRGEIRVGLGIMGFLYTWLFVYAVPLLLYFATIIYFSNKKISKLTLGYIYIIACASAISTGYKYTIIYSFIPVLLILTFNKNIVKILLLISPITLIVLTTTTKMVMGYDYETAFGFLMHRITVMTAFGSIGVWNHYPDGADFSESIHLLYSLFGGHLNSILFEIDFNSLDALNTNLSRKITYMVYPAWENALSGVTNVTVTNFGEAIYLFGSFYWIYALACGLILGAGIHFIMKNLHKGNRIKSGMWLIYFIAVFLSWLNSTTIFSLISIPVLIYLLMSYLTSLFIFKINIE
ncbi:hypothetical protein Q7Y60_00820 [Glaesserella parasuis]|uniref:Oligosaccharide repeat unit polymerase n=1 Tax=Glaesserella parasuis TaxID=738 RepID=T1RPW6_GLAPU|nr:hypothetical protein [Glaesserella parasuis]MDP0459931.1 hypothetical protein [Glaesserella parasuis]